MRCLCGLLLVAALALTGCSSRAANKTGGSQAPAVLTVGDSDGSGQPDTAAIQQFAAQVKRLSHGSVRVHIVYEAAGSDTPRVEDHVIRAVQARRFDLGWVGARAWDGFGVKSFTALQAPFLITSKHLLDRVAASRMANEMLGSLSGQRVVGLALVPDYLRHPVGITHKLSSPADFAGARIRIQPSRVTASLMRSLGAVPVEISNEQIGYAIGGKRVDGEELSVQNAVSPAILTANLTFFGKALTLFANQKTFAGLSDDQQRIVRAAAAETVRYVVTHVPPDAWVVNSTCQNRRRIVLATAAERAALLRLAQPVYRMLEADPETRRFIEQIRAWKATTPTDPPIALATPCKHTQPVASAPGPPRPASLLDGTYRWVLTLSDAMAFWGKKNTDSSELPLISTIVLRNGTWRFTGPGTDVGTFTIRGDRLRFVWPRIPSILVFAFTRDTDATIHLKPVLPMDRGDQFVWSGKPWKRIGPPTRIAP